jgi:hypothetical protein
VGGGGGGVNTGRRPYRSRPPKRDFRNQVKPEKSHRPHEDEGGALDTVSVWLAKAVLGAERETTVPRRHDLIERLVPDCSTIPPCDKLRQRFESRIQNFVLFRDHTTSLRFCTGRAFEALALLCCNTDVRKITESEGCSSQYAQDASIITVLYGGGGSWRRQQHLRSSGVSGVSGGRRAVSGAGQDPTNVWPGLGKR